MFERRAFYPEEYLWTRVESWTMPITKNVLKNKEKRRFVTFNLASQILLSGSADDWIKFGGFSHQPDVMIFPSKK